MFALSAFGLPTWLEETFERAGRKALRERSGLQESRPPPLPRAPAPARPGPAGGFPELNGTAGEMDRGRACQLPRLGWGLGKKKETQRKSLGRGDTGTTPPSKWVNTRGAAGRGSGGEPRETRYSRDVGGGQKVNTHAYTQKERRGRERERSASERWIKCVCRRRLRVGPGDPLTPRCCPGPARSDRGPALSSGPTPSFLWAAGW